MNQNNESFVSTIRMDLEEAFILSKFFQNLSISIKSRSELFRLVIGEFCRLVLEKHPEYEPHSQQEILSYLTEQQFFNPLTQKRKKVFQFLKTSSVEEAQEEIEQGFSGFKKETQKENELNEASEILSKILKKGS